MLHSEFKTKWLWKWYAETKQLWFQCVAWVKKYSEEVFWIKLKSFWWTALSWFLTWSPFKWLPFIKILNTPDFVPKVWDIVFFDKEPKNLYWHVWIVDVWTTVKTLKVLNQNMKTWTWHWKWDEFSISTFNYLKPKCLWVYRCTKF